MATLEYLKSVLRALNVLNLNLEDIDLKSDLARLQNAYFGKRLLYRYLICLYLKLINDGLPTDYVEDYITLFEKDLIKIQNSKFIKSLTYRNYDKDTVLVSYEGHRCFVETPYSELEYYAFNYFIDVKFIQDIGPRKIIFQINFPTQAFIVDPITSRRIGQIVINENYCPKVTMF